MIVLVLMASAQFSLSEGVGGICEGRPGVEIYVVEDMQSGRQHQAAFRIREVVKGQESESVVLSLEGHRRAYGRPPVLAPGTVRLVYVIDGEIQEGGVGCRWFTRGTRTYDGRFPGPPFTPPKYHDDGFELALVFARAYVRFEQDPHPRLLAKMLTSEELPVQRAGMALLSRISHSNPPELWDVVGEAVTSYILERLPAEEGERILPLENWSDLMGRLLTLLARWHDEGRPLPPWSRAAAEITLRVAFGEGPEGVTASQPCVWLRAAGLVDVRRCQRGPGIYGRHEFLSEDIDELVRRYRLHLPPEVRRAPDDVGLPDGRAPGDGMPDAPSDTAPRGP